MCLDLPLSAPVRAAIGIATNTNSATSEQLKRTNRLYNLTLKFKEVELFDHAPSCESLSGSPELGFPASAIQFSTVLSFLSVFL